MPYVLPLVRDPDIYGKIEIMESKKVRNSENTVNRQEG
jgi:hypothetical protein